MGAEQLYVHDAVTVQYIGHSVSITTNLLWSLYIYEMDCFFFSLCPLQEKWSALYDARTILLSIQSLLAEPNNESPLNAEAAELWENQAGGTTMLYLYLYM